MKTLYLECNMGAAGDMLMSALYELLDGKEAFIHTMNALLPQVELTPEPRATCGVSGTHMKVAVHGREEHEHTHDDDHHHDHHHEHPHHDHSAPRHIAQLIDGFPLPEEVKTHARAVYDAIARAESQVHGVPVEEIHFHEVGALDAVADVTGVCYALHLLQPDQILVSPVHVGSGSVRCAHGVLPVPAPATAALLAGVPIYGGTVQGELCTPTGAALLTHFAASFGPMPVMAVQKTGYGIGTREFEQANCVRAFWGETAHAPNGEIVELVCNIDDMTPEALAFAASRLLELGALDVYTAPGTMKKGRPGHILTVLCAPEQEQALARHVLEQTSTNGLRARRCGKYFLTPGTEQAETPWGPVRIKTAQGYGLTHRKPEFEDVAALARKNNLPYQTVLEAL